MKNRMKFNIIVISLGIIFITALTYNNNAYGQPFDPVPFNEIPLVIINSEDDEYEFGADYSLDFGGETQIIHDDDAELASNMRLDEDDNDLSLEIECDSNDRCGTSLAPEDVTVYLVDRGTRDGHIARNAIPTLQLEKNDCGSQSIEDCSNFDFQIPENIVNQRYKIVVEMDFDEAEWFFINPLRITN